MIFNYIDACNELNKLWACDLINTEDYNHAWDMLLWLTRDSQNNL